MADFSDERGRDEATERFYSKQRGSADSGSTASSNRDQPQRVGPPAAVGEHPACSLDAFLACREENAYELLGTFTQLTEADKLRILAGLEGEDGSDADAAESSESQGTKAAAKKPVANYVELRRRLQEQEIERRRTEAAKGSRRQQSQQQHVDATSSGWSTTAAHANAMSARAVRSTAPPAAAAAAVTDAADLEDLEVVELTDGTHTGNLVAFFDRGVTDVATSFDTFFGPQEPATATVSAPAAEGAPATAYLEAASSAVPPTLDEILALDSDSEMGEPHSDNTTEMGSGDMTHHEAAAAPLPATQHRVEGRDDGIESLSSSSSLSEMGSVELPGLEETGRDTHSEADGTATGTPSCALRPPSPIDVKVAEGLQRVIGEHDDCVQTFALDPQFDYDADMLGKAFRTEKAWRQP